MPEEGGSMALYGVGVAQEVTRAVVAITGTGRALTEAGGAVFGAGGAGAMTVGKTCHWR